jgi:dienelactone hydrolase
VEKGPLAFTTVDATWRDEGRKRDVPVRIYTPKWIAPADGKSADAKAETTYPVILFSHGLGGSREGGKFWAEHWAGHGYVVVVMQHAGSDEGLWKGLPPREIIKSMKAGMTLSNLGLRVGDVRFVIDEVVRRTSEKEAAFAHADAKKIGMSGHSFGAQTTLAMAGQKAPTIGGQSGLDSRIVSAIALSPNARNKRNPDRQFGDIRIPFFSITGNKDGSILDDGTRFEDRMVPYENMPAGGKYLLVFDGGDHMVFGGHTLGGRRAETPRDREIQDSVRAGTLAFWNATLKADEKSRQWLSNVDGGFKSVLMAADVFGSK